MKRDLTYFYPVPLPNVYNAYVQTAIQRLNKNCEQKPYFTISFALNYSFKYNMNGGACTIHFMPYQNGTAVNLRYTVVQLLGARYEAHANEINKFAGSILGVNAQKINLDVNLFLNYAAGAASQAPRGQYQQAPAPAQNNYAPAQAQQPSSQQAPQPVPQRAPQAAQQPMPQPVQQPIPQPVQQNAPQPSPQQSAGTVICSGCGKRLTADSRFCTSCGKPVSGAPAAPAAPAAAVCPHCGKQLEPDEVFCVRCGTRRN